MQKDSCDQYSYLDMRWYTFGQGPNGVCYKVVDDAVLNWFEARENCKSKVPATIKSDLLYIDDAVSIPIYTLKNAMCKIWLPFL